MLCAIQVVIPAISTAEQSALDALAGNFVYAGGQTERSSREKAVDSIVNEMNALIRALARRRLLEVTQPWPRLSFKVSGPTLSITRSDKIPSTVELGGGSVAFTNKWGDQVNVRRRFSKGTIIEVIGDGNSGQTNTYRLTPDGKRLRVRCTIKSPRLPGDIIFGLTYKRV